MISAVLAAATQFVFAGRRDCGIGVLDCQR
jgi:hypothetical protein